MAPVVFSLPSASRARSYVFRLPLFTRVVVGALVGVWVVQVVVPGWDLQAWGALVPAEVGLSSSKFDALFVSWVLGGGGGRLTICCLVYRTNTYPFIHLGFFHMLMNVLALTPLLERFESEYGTLTALALFMGRESIPLPFPCSHAPSNS